MYIGTSGFSYPHWKGVFYPPDTGERQWLDYYARHFSTVELNATFYRLPAEATFRSWAARAPGAFLYAVKLSRYITHIKRLREVRDPLELFTRRARLLGEHLGPLLVQLPPGLRPDLPLLEDFLALCAPELRWTVEFRDPSWLRDATYAALSRHNAALCIHDIIEDHPLRATADFVYARFHGAGVRYGGNYPDEHLRRWAGFIRAWQEEGRDVYAYLNNDIHGYAVQNARTLIAFCQE